METTIEKPKPMSYGERFVMNFIMATLVKNLPIDNRSFGKQENNNADFDQGL